MQLLAGLVKTTLPNYLAGLPIPDSFGGWFRLGCKYLRFSKLHFLSLSMHFLDTNGGGPFADVIQQPAHVDSPSSESWLEEDFHRKKSGNWGQLKRDTSSAEKMEFIFRQSSGSLHLVLVNKALG